MFSGRTDVEAEAPKLWPPDEKNWLVGKDPDAGKDWGQEEKGTTDNEMVGWNHRLNGREFGQMPRDSEGQGSLACYSPWGHSVRLSLATEQQQQQGIDVSFPGGWVEKNLPAMWVQSLGQEDPLEKEMRTRSSILAWRILWTEEPGGLQSWGHKRVGHNLVINSNDKVQIPSGFICLRFLSMWLMVLITFGKGLTIISSDSFSVSLALKWRLSQSMYGHCLNLSHSSTTLFILLSHISCLLVCFFF